MAAIPKPPEARNPVMMRTTVITAGTKTGLNIISRGVATANAITVPASVKPERTRRDPPAATPVATFTICAPVFGWSLSRVILLSRTIMS